MLIGLDEMAPTTPVTPAAVERLEEETVLLSNEIDLLRGYFCRPFHEDENGNSYEGPRCRSCLDCATFDGMMKERARLVAMSDAALVQEIARIRAERLHA